MKHFLQNEIVSFPPPYTYDEFISFNIHKIAFILFTLELVFSFSLKHA